MTSLTDRYVHVTVRNLDEGQRHDVEQELRGTIEDMVDARLDAGAAASRDDAERAVLVELGDPMRLAAEYTGRPLHLIGPAIYPEWRRLVTLLLWTVVPVVTVINLVLRLFVDDLASEGVGAAFASSAGLGLQVALHVVFWTTLVYALVERSQPGKAVIAWDPDQLPEDDGRSVGIGETVSSVVMLLLVGLALIWQQTNSPLEVDGESVPVLDPALWSGWIPFLLGVVVAQIVVALAVFRARRWTWEGGDDLAEGGRVHGRRRPSGGLRAHQRHVVERRHEDAAVAHREVHVGVEVVVVGDGGLLAGTRRR
jgi:hypothetical protein